MGTATLGELVREVRAEAGHALTASQGLNTLDTLKHLIRRTEKELWTAFDWPQLIVRWDLSIQLGQVEYQYPADLQYDQIRHVFWAQENGTTWTEVEFGIPENGIMAYGEASKVQTGNTIQFWDTFQNTEADESRIRVWPTPMSKGILRIKGLKPLNCLVNDDDCCTLDATLITLLVSSELLTRAKADDAQVKTQKAQRHLQKLLANKTSKKLKVSTFGANRRSAVKRLTPYIDYIP